jgi:hypothetical protein
MRVKRAHDAPMDAEIAIKWHHACFDGYGIAVEIRPLRKGWEVVHAPYCPCGLAVHKPRSRRGACPRHRTYGASPFCAECEGRA